MPAKLASTAYVIFVSAPSWVSQVLVTAVYERGRQAMDLYTPLYHRMSAVLATYTDEQVEILHRFAQQTVEALREETDRLTER